jgi:hypothetical protein
MAGALLGATTANADTKIDDTHVRVEAGDTVSSIANKYGTDVSTIASASNLSDANKIFVGDILVLTPEAQQSTTNNVQAPVVSQAQPASQATVNTQPVQNQPVQSQAPVQQSTTPVQSQPAKDTTNSSLAGNSMAALRRSIESGGNYNTNTGNGYIGAYQFAPQTIAGIESATGMKWSMDPATQDAFANYYANSRYGGWQNTPKTGGW